MPHMGTFRLLYRTFSTNSSSHLPTIVTGNTEEQSFQLSSDNDGKLPQVKASSYEVLKIGNNN